MKPAAATRSPTRQRADLRSDRIDDAGAIDAGNKRQHRAACGFLAGAQADVEHAIDGRGVHLDANFAAARFGIGECPRSAERRAVRIRG